jgi:Kelch motif/Galactose oxidase, central domain
MMTELERFEARFVAAYRRYLAEAPVEVDAAGIDAAVAHARAHPRRQGFFGTLWRVVTDALGPTTPVAHRSGKIAFNAIVAVIVVGLAGALLLNRGQANPAVPGPSSAAAAAPSAVPTSPATRTTGSMTSERANQTATLLADGRILIAGGVGSVKHGNLILKGESVASAELYDPKTGTFSATGSMTVPRDGHTATLLTDGRVLVAGGWDDGEALASAELYDPKTGTFSATGSMTVPRDGHTATLLTDGRVLIVGGDDGSNAFATAEIYDPKTLMFSSTGPMTTPRTGAAATRLADGRVLVVGGAGPRTSSPVQASAEVYNPKTGTFSATGSMITARDSQTITLLPDGRVLVAGGSDSNGQGLTSAEVYDPKTGTFSATGSMTAARFNQTATLLSDGRVMVAGGFVNGGLMTGGYTNTVVASLASAELYDPKTGAFTVTGSMSTPRAAHTATLLPDGRVLVAGGFANTAGQTLASTDLYDPKTGTFSATGP